MAGVFFFVARMAVLDKILGSLLIGAYANSILYTVELLAIIRYFSALDNDRDSRLVKAMISFVFLSDTLCTVSNYACVYLYTVTHWGDINYLQRQYWPIIVLVVTSGISAAIVQSFLIYRFWRMTKYKIITTVLVLLMLTALAGSARTTVSMSVNTAYSQRNNATLYVAIWITSSACADVAITSVLLWQLSRLKSPYRPTQSLIHKLMASTIQTGAATSMLALMILVTFFIDKQSNVPTGFAFCLGRVYAITMLYSFNNRGALRREQIMSNDLVSRETGNSVVLNGIHVLRTEAVHYESSTTHVKDEDMPGLQDKSPGKDKDEDSSLAREKAVQLPMEP